MDGYKIIKKRFEDNADAENAIKMAAYMKNKFKFYGIATPVRKKLYQDILNDEKKGKQIDWEFADMCFDDEYREFQYFVMDYLTCMQRFLVFNDVEKIRKYLKTKQWWDTVDGFDRIIGDIGLKDNRIDALMLDWSLDEDLWIRRVAIDHQLLRKERTNTALLEEIICNNFGGNEFFIDKAIGWSLREYSKTNPEWVKVFVEKYRHKMSKLSITEASKYI